MPNKNGTTGFFSQGNSLLYREKGHFYRGKEKLPVYVYAIPKKEVSTAYQL